MIESVLTDIQYALQQLRGMSHWHSLWEREERVQRACDALEHARQEAEDEIASNRKRFAEWAAAQESDPQLNGEI